jgi:uncharacterized membrane protein
MNTVPKRIWVILGISIAANLFFAGLIAGRVVTHRDRPHHAATTFARTREATSQLQSDLHNTLLEVADKLTPAQRKRLAESLWPHRSKR